MVTSAWWLPQEWVCRVGEPGSRAQPGVVGGVGAGHGTVPFRARSGRWGRGVPYSWPARRAAVRVIKAWYQALPLGPQFRLIESRRSPVLWLRRSRSAWYCTTKLWTMSLSRCSELAVWVYWARICHGYPTSPGPGRSA